MIFYSHNAAQKINQAVEAFRKKHYAARQSFLALEDRFKSLSTFDEAYTNSSVVSMPRV